MTVNMHNMTNVGPNPIQSMAKHVIITDCPICAMFIYHIHTPTDRELWATAYQIQR